VKRIFRGCELQITGEMCVTTEGLLLHVVGMKLDVREAFVLKELEG
jgi:hypothetical protein